MNRHVLFYSNYCHFSKNVLTNIIKKDLKEMFVLVCVDKRNIQLPDFVDRVPLIFTMDRRMLVDDAVSAFIDGVAEYIATVTRSSSTLATAQPDDDVSAWSTLEMGSRGISDRFSFLEGGSECPLYSHNFVDVNHNPTITTVVDDGAKENNNRDGHNNTNGGSNSVGYSQSASLESLQAMRDNDLKPYMPAKAPTSIDFTSR
jgi:hypothetical protein